MTSCLAVWAVIAADQGCTDESGQGDASSRYEASFESLPNGALHFDGAGDYATTGTAGFPSGAAPQTISLWVRYGSSSGMQAFVALRTDYASGVVVGIRDGQVAVWPVYGKTALVETATLPAVGAWHHVAFVLDRGDAGAIETLYIDGVVSATAAAAPNKLTPLSCWLGSLDGMSQFFGGDLDEIRIWSVARASSEIAEDMRGATAPDANGLVAYFDCNAIRGTRVADNSGNGNDATLGGGDPTRTPTLVASSVPPQGPGDH